jgi:hypothetical protein
MLLTQEIRRALSFAFANVGQEHAGQNGDDRNDHQQFDQCERILRNDAMRRDTRSVLFSWLNSSTGFGWPVLALAASTD